MKNGLDANGSSDDNRAANNQKCSLKRICYFDGMREISMRINQQIGQFSCDAIEKF